MKKTKRGRIFAFVMAIVTVFSLIPILGSRVQAAGNSANDTIKGILGHDDYVPQMNRSRYRSTSKIDNTYINYGGYYYSSRSSKLKDENGKEYAGAGGICTWCAFTNLLNRRVAYDGKTRESFEANKFDILSVAKRIGNTSEGVRFWGASGEREYLWIGNKKSFDDVYTKSFDNGKGRSYTGVQKNLSKDIRDLTGEALTNRVNAVKETLKAELDNHPEGIVIQFSKDSSNMHGIVLTGYYYTQGYLSFYTVDTAGTYGDGFTPIESSYLGTHYGNQNYNGAQKLENIVKYIAYYVYLTSPSGDLADPGPVGIKDLSIDGKTSAISLVQGAANLMGKVISGSIITSIQAFITNTSTGETKYNNTIYPNATSVDLKGSALNTGSSCIKFGNLGTGSFKLTVKATDADTKTLNFTITSATTGITIDLSAFKGNLTYGQSYGIPGTITSGANISKVYARVVYGEDQYQSTATYRPGHAKAGKKVEYTVTGVNAKTFNIRNSAIDANLSMGGLRKGNYYFEVTVTDVNGNTKTARKAFSVR